MGAENWFIRTFRAVDFTTLIRRIKKKRKLLDKKPFEMRYAFFPMLPFPLPGFEVQEILSTEAAITIMACATKPTATCPACQQESHRLHSYYTRSPADLPVSGLTVRLSLRVRRFRCQNPECQQQT